MVGHTQDFNATVKAVECVDWCLGRIARAIKAHNGTLIVTADHGNCEEMMKGNSPFTAHTTNPVPFILVKKDLKLRDKGILADVAPTVLELMGIKKSEEMTGKSLILKQ